MRQNDVMDSSPGSGGPPGARLIGASTIDGLLEKASFAAPRGEVSVVFGPAGAGKSALIDVLRLAKRVQAGGADVLGVNVLRLSLTARAKLKRRIGYVAQTPTLFDHLSAIQNVLAPLRIAGRVTAADQRDAEDLFTYLGIKMRDQRPVAYLSGSERRRIAVARAVVCRPDLLLADEPCAGLAPDIAGRVLKLLLQVRRNGATVVVATQDEDLAASLPGALWRMADGAITQPQREEAGS